MSNSLLPFFHSYYETQLNQFPRSIKWRRLTTWKYLLTIEEASSFHPEVLNREVANYTKKKDRQRLKTATSGGTNILNKLVLFEQTLAKREKKLTDRESLLHQYEKEYTVRRNWSKRN
ncbi:unnamed protein product [Rhizophagus irregularis]|nr:unnamed protein product [Rhizophagus irregularis]